MSKAASHGLNCVVYLNSYDLVEGFVEPHISKKPLDLPDPESLGDLLAFSSHHT